MRQFYNSSFQLCTCSHSDEIKTCPLAVLLSFIRVNDDDLDTAASEFINSQHINLIIGDDSIHQIQTAAEETVGFIDPFAAGNDKAFTGTAFKHQFGDAGFMQNR